MSSLYPKTRLFVEAALSEGQELPLSTAHAHYLKQVLRLKEGDALALFNGRDGLWAAEILALGKKHGHVRLHSQLQPFHAAPDVWVCFAPLKFGRIDYLAQKITELGCATLQPVITDYTQASRVNIERLRGNAIEAAEQSERLDVPEVAEPVKFDTLLANWPANRPLIYGDESGNSPPAMDILGDMRPEKWALLIGPEGGFSPKEHPLLDSVQPAVGVSLGPRILRADTAAVTLLSLTQALWGDWQMRPHFNPVAPRR